MRDLENKVDFVNPESDISPQEDAFLGGSSSETADHKVNFKLGKSPQYNQEELQQIGASGMMSNALAEGTLYLINETIDQKPDTIFFLDKSARPAAYLFRETWKNLLPDTKLPNIRFINIGRDQNQESDEQSMEQLRQKFTGIEEDTILVADEYVKTGQTINRAVDTIGKIFPEAKSVSGLGMYGRQPPWNEDPAAIGVVENENDPSGSSNDYLVKPYRRHASEENKAKNMREVLSRFASDIAANCTPR